MVEPTYSFTLPSLDDDTALACRVYHPDNCANLLKSEDKRIKGAVLAHPYGPLGGSYDDHVILGVTETLLQQGYIVATFNFRGAGGSQGKNSWTARPEFDDYSSIAGFLIYYLHDLQQNASSTVAVSPRPSMDERNGSAAPTRGYGQRRPIDLLLGGYSYGSLILARLPHPSTLVSRFQQTPLGTAGAEIILRAQTLAKQTIRSFEDAQSPTQSRSRSLVPDDAATSSTKRAKASPVMIGGEETDPSERRRSRDSRRSPDVVQRAVETPKTVEAHIRRQSESTRAQTDPTQVATSPSNPAASDEAPILKVSYLLISTIILPFTATMAPPGPPPLAFTARKSEVSPGTMFLQHPTLAVIGTRDFLTAPKRFRAWAEKQAKLSGGFEWEQIEGAGHYWREDGVVAALQERVATWTKLLK